MTHLHRVLEGGMKEDRANADAGVCGICQHKERVLVLLERLDEPICRQIYYNTTAHE